MIPATIQRTIWDELPEANVDTQKLEHLFESRAKDLMTKVICGRPDGSLGRVEVGGWIIFIHSFSQAVLTHVRVAHHFSLYSLVRLLLCKKLIVRLNPIF